MDFPFAPNVAGPLLEFLWLCGACREQTEQRFEVYKRQAEFKQSINNLFSSAESLPLPASHQALNNEDSLLDPAYATLADNTQFSGSISNSNCANLCLLFHLSLNASFLYAYM